MCHPQPERRRGEGGAGRTRTGEGLDSVRVRSAATSLDLDEPVPNKIRGSNMSDARFVGKTIIITGAGGNFGRAGCFFFTQRGASVVAWDNNESALMETISEIRSQDEANGIKIEGYTCDVTSEDSVRTTLECVLSDFERIDMLWNNAGYQGQIKPTLEYDIEDFSRVMNINVTGAFIVLQSVAKVMADQSGGEQDSSHPFSIVNTASVAGLRGTPAMVAYSSSKAAILAMTVAVAKVSLRLGVIRPNVEM